MRPRCLPVTAGPHVKTAVAAVSLDEVVQAVIRVRLAPAASRRGFEEYLRSLGRVLCAWQVTGEADYELLVACSAVADLDGVLACLRSCGRAVVTSAALVLREVSGLGEVGPAGHLVPAAEEGKLHNGH
jgi:hypothetical protein